MVASDWELTAVTLPSTANYSSSLSKSVTTHTISRSTGWQGAGETGHHLCKVFTASFHLTESSAWTLSFTLGISQLLDVPVGQAAPAAADNLKTIPWLIL